MHLDLWQILGLLNWICGIQRANSLALGFHCDKTILNLFGACRQYPIHGVQQKMGLQRGTLTTLIHEKHTSQTQKPNREFVKYVLYRSPSRRKRDVKAQGESKDTSETHKMDNTGKEFKTAHAFGNPSLPKRASKRKKPAPKKKPG